MKLIFSSTRLWSAFQGLAGAARNYAPSQQRAAALRTGLLEIDVSLPPLMGAAVSFMLQLSIDALARDQVEAQGLEQALLAKLSTWVDEEGALVLRPWTHDMHCVLGALEQAAYRYTRPAVFAEALKSFEELSRPLAVAAVAFAIQLMLEETSSDPGATHSLEMALISTLEEPWEIVTLPLAVDPEAGMTWEALAADGVAVRGQGNE